MLSGIRQTPGAIAFCGLSPNFGSININSERQFQVMEKGMRLSIFHSSLRTQYLTLV